MFSSSFGKGSPASSTNQKRMPLFFPWPLNMESHGSKFLSHVVTSVSRQVWSRMPLPPSTRARTRMVFLGWKRRGVEMPPLFHATSLVGCPLNMVNTKKRWFPGSNHSGHWLNYDFESIAQGGRQAFWRGFGETMFSVGSFQRCSQCFCDAQW